MGQFLSVSPPRMSLVTRLCMLLCIHCYIVHADSGSGCLGQNKEITDLLTDLQSQVKDVRNLLELNIYDQGCSSTSNNMDEKSCTYFPGKGGSLKREEIQTLATATGFDPEEISSNFDTFLSNYPDGKLTGNDFHQIIVKAVTEENTTKMEKHLLRMYDTNNDKCIDFTEFLRLGYILGEGNEKKILSRIFLVLDVNGIGSLSMQEIRKVATDFYGLLKETNPRVASVEFLAAAAIVEMDKNKDGIITLEEFITAYMAEENVSQMLGNVVIRVFKGKDE